MPICPNCKEEFPRRKSGACPGCRTPVKIYDGGWYLLTDDAPNIALLNTWEQQLSERTKTNFSIPRKSSRYKREAAVAQRLLDEAEGDLTVAETAMDILHTHKDFSWKTYTSLLSVEKDWLVALFMARTTLEEEARREEARRQRANELEHMEDIWN
jgi:hypothetical protein